MKILKKLFAVSLIFVCSSCALMFNDKKSSVYVSSNPPGASVIIEGRNYGMTPTVLNLETRPYEVSLMKEGHGSAKFKLDVWQGMEKGSDGARCMADTIGAMFVITFYSAFYSDECKTFKQEEYNVNIPFTASNYGRKNRKPRRDNRRSTQESYENPYLRQGYGRSPRLPVY